MAKEKKQHDSKVNTINIKSSPVKSHIGTSKFHNEDWGTVAFVIPRDELTMKFADIELQYNCIYFLIGYDGTQERIYVGQAKKRNNGGSVLIRLREHNDSTTEKYRDKWKWAIVVTNKDDTWGLDDLNALENAFYHEIPASQNLNGNTPNSAGANFEAYTDKIQQIKSYVTSIGFTIFDTNEEDTNIQVTSEVNEYTVVEDLQNGMARIPEIVTPQKVVKAMVDMLPAEVWNDQTKFLDPACKGGEYLREIFDRLMETESLIAKYPSEIERAFHILQHQLYGIALSQVSLERTSKKLMGYSTNIKIIPNYIGQLKELKNENIKPRKSKNNKETGEHKNEHLNIIDKINNLMFGENREMKFDVVIGNPPYQDCNGGGGNTDSGKAIYQDFVNLAISIKSRYIIMITKNSWYRTRDTGGNKGFDSMKHYFLTDGHLVEIIDYPIYGEVFRGIGCAVSYFLADLKKTDKYYRFISIINNKKTEEFIVNSTNLKDVIRGEYLTGIVDKLGEIQGMNKYTLSKLAFGIDTPGVTDNSIIKTEYYNNKLISKNDVCFINIKDIPKTELLEYYKVICTRAVSAWSANTENVITSIKMLKPKEVCSGTYSVVYYTMDRQQAVNAEKYIKTKFVRVLLKCMIDARGVISRNTFEYVPLQDFTSSSDIDWSQPIPQIDQQLYKKYNLTDEEIAYIEKTIKPME